MDFIEGLPLSNKKDAILVVVDRFTKYIHFTALAHSFTSTIVAQELLSHMYDMTSSKELVQVAATSTSLNMTPFKDLYGYSPPHIAFPNEVLTSVADVEDYIQQRDAMLELLQDSLHKAQEMMKLYADKKRIDRTFEVGDLLSALYYDPFPVLAKVGIVAYKPQLPSSSQIHPVFHVSQLKKRIGDAAITASTLPQTDVVGEIMLKPIAMLGTREIS
ncbi:uncharacterized protein LOC113272680 [Papaver somniferum]|uniref:uncharacterized protein LOC113272680 n=1 Tax=Papaver somniferum TaxID=3469 RepID=UPI000E6F9607|nr:uncharacterized protein LOC113272680 [Papaver somniferum]